MAKLDRFINFGGKATGEAQDKHQGPIGDCDMLTYSFGVHQDGTWRDGGGGTAGKVYVQEFVITRKVDAATPKLMKLCSQGTHLPKVVMLLRRAGGTPEKPGLVDTTITLTNAIVTNVSVTGYDEPMESLTLDYAHVRYDKNKQDSEGVTSNAATFDWDAAGNVGSN